MILYLCRHGIADDSSASGRDEDRALTAEGRDKFRKAAKGFAHLEPRVGHILSSPLVRARQTAEILRDVLAKATEINPPVTLEAHLGLGARWEPLRQTIKILPGRPREVVLVGHEPFMSHLLGALCFGESSGGRGGRVEFKKGAMAALEMDADLNGGTLLWFMTAGILKGR
jgi:phosphohistidine phosphatase